MTTAEKRADLEARGEPWPICVCHDEPNRWVPDRRSASGGWFGCRVAHREAIAELRSRRNSEGVCWQCGDPLDTAWLCASCREANAETQWRHNQKLKRRLDKYLSNSRQRAKRRREEGFRPTGVGLAAFAAWTERTGK